MQDSDRHADKVRFDPVAETYEHHRPGYRPEAFARLMEATGLEHGARCLEVGCGPGQATVPLAELGLDIVAIDIGADLTTAARRNTERYPNVTVETTSLEDLEAPRGSFDIIVGASSLHWIEPDVRSSRCHELLRPDGYLALLGNDYSSPAIGVEDELAEIFDLYVPEWSLERRRFKAKCKAKLVAEEIQPDPRFRHALSETYRWEATYDADGYIGVMQTYSSYWALPPEQRDPITEAVRVAIEAARGGVVVRPWETNFFLFERC